MTTLTFGAHKGEDIEDVPTSYLRWILEKCDPPNSSLPEVQEEWKNLLSEIEDELSSREKYGERQDR